MPEEIDEPGFWEEFRRRVLAVNPEAYLVGEIWNPAPEWLAGDRFDARDELPAGRGDPVVRRRRPARPGALVAKTHEYGRHVRAIDGPEFGRQLAAVMATYPPEVASLQLNLLGSHDTPRFISLAGGDATALRLATLIQMTLPGAPCIYYGDEVGLEGREDPGLPARLPVGSGQAGRGLRDFIAGLIALRRATRCSGEAGSSSWGPKVRPSPTAVRRRRDAARSLDRGGRQRRRRGLPGSTIEHARPGRPTSPNR